MGASERPRTWLHDPTGCISRLLGLLADLEDAKALLGHVRHAGQVLVCANQRTLFGDNDLALLFSLELEERAGVDLRSRYRLHGEGCDPVRYGAIFAAPPDPSETWRARLVDARLGFERHTASDVEAARQPLWGVDLGHRFS